jgi:hypothetical protein
MIGPTIVFLCAVSLVASYIFMVNRMLRTDENWSESNQIKPNAKQEPTTLPTAVLAHA